MRSLLAFFLVILSTLYASGVRADNNYPIVLVHGFSGWGRDELLGLKYWGGLQGDLQEQLKAQGYTVFTAAVGPFSSNWDRACELYAQIKGGPVDYGVNHAKTHGHARFGRTFPGLYPQWGTVGADGKVNKIHLVGHSMGGQTIRMLAQLLAKGSAGAPIVEATSTHPLFAGGKDWVHSITTIATPNQGTLLANGFSEIGELVKSLVIGVFSVLGVGGDATQNIYDVKMDQWGIAGKQPSETLAQYVSRVFDSALFKPGFRDICLWSLSTAGAKEESTWIETLSNVYYYSYTNEDSYAWRDLFLRKIQLPNPLTMLLPLQPLSKFLGSRYGPDNGFSTDWQQNDGVVNTASMAKDAVGTLRVFDGYSRVGQWNLMPQLTFMDHLAVVGLTLHTQIQDLYVAHAKLLKSLPVGVSSSGASASRHLADANATTDVVVVGDTTATPLVAAPVETIFGLVHAVAMLNQAAGSAQTKTQLQSLCDTQATNTYAVRYCETMLSQVAGTPSRRRLLRG